MHELIVEPTAQPGHREMPLIGVLAVPGNRRNEAAESVDQSCTSLVDPAVIRKLDEFETVEKEPFFTRFACADEAAVNVHINTIRREAVVRKTDFMIRLL